MNRYVALSKDCSPGNPSSAKSMEVQMEQRRPRLADGVPESTLDSRYVLESRRIIEVCNQVAARQSAGDNVFTQFPIGHR